MPVALGFDSVDEAAENIAAVLPKNITAEELSFIVGIDGLWVACPEQEKELQVFILLRPKQHAGFSQGIQYLINENSAKVKIEDKEKTTKISIAATEPSLRRQMLSSIADTLVTKEIMIAGLTYKKPVSLLTPLMERMLLGAQLEREFLSGYKRNTDLALSQFPELNELIKHLQDPNSGEYSLVITPELAKKWELKERLAKMVKDMAVVAVAGMRNSANPLFPGDLNSPMNILLALLLSNELAEMSLETARMQNTEEPDAIVGGEVRYNTPIVSEMFRRRFAKLGFTVHSPARGVYLPIGATSYITTVLNVMFTIYDTASHSARSVYGVKLMGNLKASISPFLESFLNKIGIDSEKYKMSRSEGAQLLVEDMVEIANRIDRKISRSYEGESLVIDLAAGNDPKILFDIDNPKAKGNIDVVGKYSKYLRNAYVNKNNREIVRKAFRNGMQMGFDQTRGAAYRFFSNVYTEVFGADTTEKVQWTGTMPDSFFGDTGMSDFNSKQPPDAYVAEYVQAKGNELDGYFSNAAFGTSFLVTISEQSLAKVVHKKARLEKSNDLVTIRFKVFAKEEESVLKRFGMPYRILSSGKLLAYYRPKISDFSQDVSLLEVVINSKLPVFMLSKPIGYVHPITDPDGDRFVVAQVERNTELTKKRLEKFNIAYVVLSKEKVLAVYVPNQTFLQIQDAYIQQLTEEGKFSQDLDNSKASTFFAIKTTVSSDTWLVLYDKKGVPVVQVPVGFKEIGAIMRKVELQLLTNEIRASMGLSRRMVVVHDIFGKPVRLGYNPRLLFAGEESGGMIQGSSDMLRSEDNLRFYLSWREKNAIEASICTTIMLSQRFNKAFDAALGRGVLQENMYNDEQFLEDISLSRMFSETLSEIEVKRNAELRADVLLIDPLTAAQASRDERDKMTKDGIYRRDANFNFYLSLAFALQDGHISLDDVKAILKEVLLQDEEMLKRIIAVTDSTAPQLLSQQIDDIQRFEFVGDAVRMEFSHGAWQVIRPSGTEPKVKSYPSSDDARFSAVICNAIGEAFPKAFFEIIQGKNVPSMSVTTAYITKMLTADPDLIDGDLEDINKNAITLRQRFQYQRGLIVDTVPGWVDNDVYELLKSRELFREKAQDGASVSSVNVFLGPASQKESLRYDPQANIIYISWEFDNQMYLAKAQDKIKLLDEQLENLSIVDVKSSSKASVLSRKNPIRMDGGKKNILPAGLLEITMERNPGMTAEKLREIWAGFESANSNIFSKLGGEELNVFVAYLKNMLENGTLDRSRQKVILFSEEDSRKPGFYPVVKALREFEKVKVKASGKETNKPVLRIAVYGEDSGKVRILAENSNIIVAQNLNDIMDVLYGGGIRNQDIVMITGSADKALDHILHVRQIIAGEVLPLTIGLSLKSIFGTGSEQGAQIVREAFGAFFDKLAKAGVVSGEPAKKMAVVDKDIELGSVFDLPRIVPMEKSKSMEVDVDIKKVTQALTNMGV
ncbi:MAG: hypothetical protein WBE75_04600 [Candidatus Omnitrophota bacterium]